MAQPAAPGTNINPARLRALVDLWERLSYLPLSQRLVAYVLAVRAQGDVSAFARPAHYFAAAEAGSTNTGATYALTLDQNTRAFVMCSMQAPMADMSSVIVSEIMKGGVNMVDADAWAGAFMTSNTDLDDGRELPHPVVMYSRGQWSFKCTGTNVSTSGIEVHGFAVDAVTAAVIEAAGELWVEGVNKTYTFSAAVVIGAEVVDRVMKSRKHQTHLVSQEVITGNAAVTRANVNLLVKGDKLMPSEGKSLPGLSLVKGAALCDVEWAPGDTFIMDTRYTSNGDVNPATGTLRLVLIGRRVYVQTPGVTR